MQGKRGRVSTIALAPGSSSEKQKNELGDAMLVVLEGLGTIICAGEEKTVEKSHAFFIHKGSEYEVRNNGKETLIYALITGEPEKNEAG